MRCSSTVCLSPVATAQCSSHNPRPCTSAVPIGGTCEADGECALADIDNCELFDVYTRVACPSTSSPPPPPPPPPPPSPLPPATTTGARWTLAPRGQSCDTYCIGIGSTCDISVWPKTQAAADAVIAEAGVTCSTIHYGGSWDINPGLYHGYSSSCYMGVTYYDFVRTCAAAHSGVSRMCKCAG